MSSDLLHLPPTFSEAEAKNIAQQIYGLSDFLCLLPSERDQNFLFARGEEKFLLKISNLAEEESVLSMQHAAIERLKTKVKVIRTCKGDLFDRVEKHFVRLLSYLPGQPLGTFPNPSLKLFFNLGILLGGISRSLAQFDHPAGRRTLQWNMTNAPNVLRDFKDRIPERRRRELIEAILHDWLSDVLPSLSSLRMSIIHNDANEYNIIVEDEETLHLIDYGDMCHSYTLCEVAIACAYAMLNHSEPLLVAREILRAYRSVFPLEDLEVKFFEKFLRMRLAMSVTISAQQKSLQPDNDYLLISERPAWALLERWTSFEGRFFQL